MSSLAMADLSSYLATGDKRLVVMETVGKEVEKPSEGMNVLCGTVRCGVVWCDPLPSPSPLAPGL